MTDAPAPDAKALVRTMVDDPTLDAYFNKNPARLSQADHDFLIELERQRRVDFIAKDSQ